MRRSRPQFDSHIKPPGPKRFDALTWAVLTFIVSLFAVALVSEARDDAETKRQFEKAWCESFTSRPSWSC